MPTATLHLRTLRGRSLCGSHGPTLPITAIEHYARLRTRRCGECWRELVAILAAVRR